VPRPKLTPHQRIVRAAQRGAGLRLSADEVFTLGVMDDAIVSAALNDDERQENDIADADKPERG